MSTPALVKLTPFLRSQYGLVTNAQAAEAGVHRSTLRRAVDRGHLVQVDVGIYASATHPASWEQAWMAARLSVPGAVVSHAAAAHLHGLEQTGSRTRPPLELTVRRHRDTRRRDGLVVHTASHLRPEDVTRSGPWEVTTPAWTLCSLAHRLGPGRLERAFGAAVARSQTTLQELALVADRFHACPGAPVIRAVLRRVDPAVRLTRSEYERLFLRLLRLAGLPAPRVNHAVTDADGQRRILDFAWPDLRLAVEIDVHPIHATVIGRMGDAQRQNALVLDGWTVLRFDAHELVDEPSRVVDEVRAALRR